MWRTIRLVGMNVTVLIQGHDFDVIHHFPNIKYFMASFEGKSSEFSTAWRFADALFLLLKVCFEAFANESTFYWISIMSHFTSSVTASNFKFWLCFIIYSAYTAFLIFFFILGKQCKFSLNYLQCFLYQENGDSTHTVLKLFFIFQGIPNMDTPSVLQLLKENHMPSFS